VLQVELHPYNSQAALIKVAQLLGVIITGYSQFGPMGYREIGGDKNTGLLFDHPVIKQVAQAHGKTPAQVLLRWLTQRNITVMPKATRNESHRRAESNEIYQHKNRARESKLSESSLLKKRVGRRRSHFSRSTSAVSACFDIAGLRRKRPRIVLFSMSSPTVAGITRARSPTEDGTASGCSDSDSSTDLEHATHVWCLCYRCVHSKRGGSGGCCIAKSTWEKHMRKENGGHFRLKRALQRGVRKAIKKGSSMLTRPHKRRREAYRSPSVSDGGNPDESRIGSRAEGEDIATDDVDDSLAEHGYACSIDSDDVEPCRATPPTDLHALSPDQHEPAGASWTRAPQSASSVNAPNSRIEEINLANKFIDLLKGAKLESDVEPLEPDVLKGLLEPACGVVELSMDQRLSIDLYLAMTTASEQTYNAVRTVLQHDKRCKRINILSYYSAKTLVHRLSGVSAVWRDMCVKSCVAFTGPFADLEHCPTCGQERYEKAKRGSKNVPRKQFSTVLLGPQLQALWRSPESAKSLEYRRACTERVLAELDANGGDRVTPYSDLFHGSDYLDAVEAGHIREEDMVLMLSIDGAQLYRNKASDCWMYIWVIMDHSPDKRYKKRYVLPAGFIPGPHKPGNLDSYLFPALWHLSALQHEGLRIWDASRDACFRSYPFLALVTADGPGMAAMNGFVGHHGKCHCRLYCPLAGRHKPGASHYYPARLRPRNYDVQGCSHPDVDLDDLLRSFGPDEAAERYEANLAFLTASQSRSQYEARRLQTGIVKPSIFSGLPSEHVSRIPSLFAGDCMHLPALNIPDLLIPLWRGTFDCDKADDKKTWPWATLSDKDRFIAHGKCVDDAKKWIPGSHDRAPRNPAEKINSGYKAWEFLLWFYGLGPCLFYRDLPREYWHHYCKLVRAIRLLLQQEILPSETHEAHRLLTEWSTEFEELYVQRRADRIHFVRASVHAPSHMPFEVGRIGPGIIYSQWTIERTIGNLGEEIKQHANAFANLMQRGIRRCQVNALKAMIPDLTDSIERPLPRGAHDLGHGYAFLRATDCAARDDATDLEARAMRRYLRRKYPTIGIQDEWRPLVVRWARLSLPNGQIARSRWKEEDYGESNDVRVSRHVKVSVDGSPRIAEIHYFMNLSPDQTEEHKNPVVVVSMFGLPH
ncbi:hypothetical protein HDZ31DRAFT_77554, partial [Schizophyllum fasciatum]